MVCLECRNWGVLELGLYGTGMLEKVMLLLLNIADMDCLYVEGCGVSRAEYSVHLVGVNRRSGCIEFCGVHSWQNGTRCRDGLKWLWCHSHLVGRACCVEYDSIQLFCT